MVLLDGETLTLDALLQVAEEGATAELSADARGRVAEARAVVDAKARGDEAVYGINTGFGSLSDVRIGHADLATLQVNLLRSHAAGVGEPLDVAVVRAMMTLRANVLAKGFSGIRPETLEALLALIARGVHPVVPSRGSVGASGDLAPLAHLALVLIGEGEALPPGATAGAPPVLGLEALRRAGLLPVTLAAKEGLALINGTQASTAVLALALARAERLARAADVVAALSIDALRGSVHPFEARVHEPRPHAGQLVSAANILALVAGSGINQSHAHCGKVQDAYSLRCAAQVHGAARDAIAFVRRTVEIEANAATDNPMVFAGTGDIVSGGNFHGAPIAVAADVLCLAAAQLATISERRCDRLLNPALSDLPPFLTTHSGLHSGLMMAQVTAAALASEVKTLAHPASVDTIPTSASKEDHVSMSMAAALKARRAVDTAIDVLAIEALCACQAIDLLAPLTTSAPLAAALAHVRASVAMLIGDRSPAPDIAAISRQIACGSLVRACGTVVK
jgi:histidine ammonia-lyase